MIASNDIKTMLYKEVKNSLLGKEITEISKNEHAPVVEFKVSERIVLIVSKSINDDWQETVARVCIYVPDLHNSTNNVYTADEERLTELQNISIALFKRKLFLNHAERTVYCRMESVSQDKDPATWSHFINMKLIIRNTNFKV